MCLTQKQLWVFLPDVSLEIVVSPAHAWTFGARKLGLLMAFSVMRGGVSLQFARVATAVGTDVAAVLQNLGMGHHVLVESALRHEGLVCRCASFLRTRKALRLLRRRSMAMPFVILKMALVHCRRDLIHALALGQWCHWRSIFRGCGQMSLGRLRYRLACTTSGRVSLYLHFVWYDSQLF